MADLAQLLAILNLLVDGGNTVIVIEHNLDVVQNADWVIDLGPEGGSAASRLVAPSPLSTAQRFLLEALCDAE